MALSARILIEGYGARLSFELNLESLSAQIEVVDSLECLLNSTLKEKESLARTTRHELQYVERKLTGCQQLKRLVHQNQDCKALAKVQLKTPGKWTCLFRLPTNGRN
eukprot:TRINITY_DN27835_c0_g1_i2.p1 TRINITY_DN27835_c0_g1~~TRINITY_DN27835_c0_g1_i2.p1  ORF type:complete len:124 (+),score=14.66 TRINITY_DN27835_c0_g1_i2:53-373(+)